MSNLISELKNRFLFRLASVYLVYALITILFFSFSGDVKDWTDVAGTLVFLALWNLLIPHLTARGLFVPLKNALQSRQEPQIQREMALLQTRTLALMFLIGVLYIGLITYLGTKTQAEAYENFWRVLEFSLSMLFSYILIPLFFLNLVLDEWSQSTKEILFMSLGVQFRPGKGHIKNEILGAFIILALFPLGTIYLSLGANGFLEEILKLNPYLFSYMVIIILGIGFFVFLKARAFSKPLGALAYFVERVGKGDYTQQTPVVEENEIGLLTAQINSMVQGLQERERMRDLFGKAVDPTVRDHLLQSRTELGGEVRNLTVLFADIRGFTALSETRSPQDVVTLLNRYFDRMNRVIVSKGGLINKFIGDAILAVFGLKEESRNHGDQALDAARMMLQELDVLNTEWISEGLPSLQIGIGIHTGNVIAGTVGSQDRMEFTVIGDVVNTASRLEGLTKHLQCPLVFSKDLVQILTDPRSKAPALRSLGTKAVTGRNEPIEIWTSDLSIPGQSWSGL